MVGSVLMQRMQDEGDFANINPVFFSTSNAGGAAPSFAGPAGGDAGKLEDAFDVETLAKLPIIVTAQGGDYTKQVHGELRSRGWDGLWIDAASTLRMNDDSIIVLDPINRDVIDKGLAKGTKDFIGGNCTVSCMLMGLGGLFKHGLVEWGTSMTYQAASGAGAKNMRELVEPDGRSTAQVENGWMIRRRPSWTLTARCCPPAHPTSRLAISGPAGRQRPHPVDRLGLDNGQTREEWKGVAETNKILGTSGDEPIPMDGLCVRIGAMRCIPGLHHQAEEGPPVDRDRAGSSTRTTSGSKSGGNTKERDPGGAYPVPGDRHPRHSGGPPPQAEPGA